MKDLDFTASPTPNGRYVELDIDMGNSASVKLFLNPEEAIELRDKLKEAITAAWYAADCPPVS